MLAWHYTKRMFHCRICWDSPLNGYHVQLCEGCEYGRSGCPIARWVTVDASPIDINEKELSLFEVEVFGHEVTKGNYLSSLSLSLFISPLLSLSLSLSLLLSIYLSLSVSLSPFYHFHFFLFLNVLTEFNA